MQGKPRWWRDPEKERAWRQAIKRQAKSGMTIRAFCRSEGLSEPSFHAWRRELNRRDAEKTGKKRAAGNNARAAATKQATVGQKSSRTSSRSSSRSENSSKNNKNKSSDKSKSSNKNKRKITSPSGATAAFVPVTVIPEMEPAIELVLAREPRIRVPAGFDRRTLADVLAVLEERRC